MLLLASLGLGGCSAPRLAYDNGPTLVWWWLDGYVDFTDEQAAAVRDAIDRWFAWHRSTQLPAYASMLAELQAEVMAPTTADGACRWSDRLVEQLQPALDRALVEAAGQLPRLGEAQFKHIERRYAKADDEMRDEFLQPDPAERLQAAVERTVERMQTLYGRLDEQQKAMVARRIAASPFDPEAWLAERRRRQREVVATLRRLSAERADADARLAALRGVASRWQSPPNPEYRAGQIALRAYNCAFAADLHNSLSARQRQAARDKLKGWEQDLRMLAAPAG